MTSKGAQPSHAVFDEIKNATVRLWKSHPNTVYAESKMTYYDKIPNLGGNAMIFYRDLEPINKVKLSALISAKASEYIHSQRDEWDDIF